MGVCIDSLDNNQQVCYSLRTVRAGGEGTTALI